jgi:hypothetical protein
MKARIAKKLLKTFIQQQVVLVPPCSILVIKSDEMQEEGFREGVRHLRKVLDDRKVDIRVVLVLPESAQIDVVRDSTSQACPSSSLPLADDSPSK